MAKFVLCSVSEVRYTRDNVRINNPINLDLCKTIKKTKYAAYPDNRGIPCITFCFTDKTTESWSYEKEQDRDSDYNRIVSGGDYENVCY